MLQALALIIGMMVIFAVIFGAGMLMLGFLGMVLAFAFFMAKTLFFILLILLIPLTPIVLLATLFRMGRRRTLPGTTIPVNTGLILAVLILIGLVVWGTETGISRWQDVSQRAQDFMEKCEGNQDEPSVDVTVDGKTYHFSCQSMGAKRKRQTDEQSM